MKIFLIICLILLIPFSLSAQFKSQAEQQSSISNRFRQPTGSTSTFLGFFNPNNFLMRHNFAMSYLSTGGRGVSLASYTNSIFYQFSDPLNVRFDLTLIGSPIGQYNKIQQNDFNKLFLSQAELNYKPFKNFLIQFQYHQSPYFLWETCSPMRTTIK